MISPYHFYKQPYPQCISLTSSPWFDLSIANVQDPNKPRICHWCAHRHRDEAHDADVGGGVLTAPQVEQHEDQRGTEEEDVEKWQAQSCHLGRGKIPWAQGD